MKFAHQYHDTLAKEDFPDEWLKSAISYRQLKKCIKALEGELASIGLHAETLGRVVQAVEGPEHESAAPFQYSITGDQGPPVPRLYAVVNTRDGVPFDARLSTDTKTYLQSLTASRRSSDGAPQANTSHATTEESPLSDEPTGSIETIEIPLASDSTFFGLLKHEITALDELQEQEQTNVTTRINEVGQTIAAVAAHSSHDLYQWRDIFDVYLQAKVLFSTNDPDAQHRRSAEAQQRLTWFIERVTERSRANRLKQKESRVALRHFLSIHVTLLRNLRFQEINDLALSKILKKFDKRTALGAKTKFLQSIGRDPFFARTMAKALSFKVSEEIVSLIPQMNDYLCPICFSISYKPVRLTCQHVFCIRCLVTMQRDRAKNCPLCRGNVVMEADSANLDPKLMVFLQTYFPKEVKTKQRENERAAAVDRWGEGHNRCLVM
ncbi:MAG: hypothetical protein M1838_001723 [Thelocarpon superellum]|nr:MAG: hypothetical protein M1838_001723 [Thelocarpon superellum]